MVPLNLPAFEYKVKSEGQRTQIFDRIRKKYVALTPEEWVRQHFINFLHVARSYPFALMQIEGALKYNRQQKRSDILVYNKQGKPALLVECKAPEVKITDLVFSQAARYNSQLKVNYIIVTNGMDHYCCEIDHASGSYSFMEDIPTFSLL